MNQLKPQDLRIGNYFTTPTIEDMVKFQKVRSITEEYINGIAINIIEPIPITEEILLMAGFNKVKNSKESHLHKESFNWYSSMPEHIEIEHDNGISVTRRDIECKYLNQLQNLFHSIYNEELEINLK